MTNFKDYAILIELLRLMEEERSWSGETHLQKSVFILKTGMGVDTIPFSFIMYKHGPYSFDLHEEIGVMLNLGLIQSIPNPGFGPSLRPTPLGLKLCGRFPTTIERVSGKLICVASHFGRKTVSQLERIATALYVQVELPRAERGRQIERFVELKPYLTPEAAEMGFKELEAGLAPC